MNTVDSPVTTSVFQRLFAILLIFIAIYLAYSKTLDNPFFWDDTYLITDNYFIHDLSNIKNIFNQSYFNQPIEISYRPVTTLSFFADYALWGEYTGGYHGTNLVLHFLNCLIVLALIARLTRFWLGAGTALLFALHPVQTEAINMVTFREDLLCMALMGSALLLYIKYRDRGGPGTIALAVILYLLALFSKETAVMFPAVILGYEYIFRQDSPKRTAWINTLVFAVPAVFYLAMRFGPMRGPQETLIYHGNSFYTTMILAVQATGRYINLLLWPFQQCADYIFNENPSWLDTETLAAIFIILGAIAFCMLLLTRRRGAMFGVLWFVAFILPVSNIIPIGVVMAERYLYIPSAGFFIAFSFVLYHFFIAEDRPTQGLTAPMMGVLLAVMIAVSGYLTYQRNNVWETPVAFWEDTCDCAPYSARAAINLGLAYLDQDRLDESGKTLIRAVRIASRGTLTDIRYGSLYRGLTNLGIVAARQGHLKTAAIFLNDAIEVKPDASRPHLNLGKVYLQMGRIQSAEKELKLGLTYEPGQIAARMELAGIYHLTKRYDDALGQYAEVLNRDPDNFAASNKIAMIYKETGQIDEAIRQFEKGVEMNPVDAIPRLNLTTLYWRTGRLEDALEQCEALLELAPDNKRLLRLKEKLLEEIRGGNE